MPWKPMNDLNSFTKLTREERHAKQQFADLFTEYLESKQCGHTSSPTPLQLKRWFQRWERVAGQLRKNQYFSREPEHIIPYAQRHAYNTFLRYKGFSENEIHKIDVTGPIYSA